jgi:hypothetical protein
MRVRDIMKHEPCFTSPGRTLKAINLHQTPAVVA